MILAIDTSAGQCAVALVGDGVNRAEAQPMERGHAEALMPMVERVTGGDYAPLSRIAVCTGPGSFTGLRVSVAAARGLALGLGVPCIGVSRFEALVPPAGAGHVALRGRGDTVFLQAFAEGAVTGEPWIASALPDGPLAGDGDGGNGLPDPRVIALLAAERPVGAPPAPLYLRAPKADLPREAPPLMLD